MSLPKIHELFRNITEDVSDVMPWDVHFFHGHMREVVNVVKALAQDPDTDKRYPLIALQHDVKQSPKAQGLEIACKLYIVTLSDPHYLADDRYTNIFDVYLRPIFRQFVQAVADSGYFEQATVDEVNDKLTFYERLFWGSSSVMGNDANIFGDWVDCIEIDFDGLTAFNLCTDELQPETPYLISAMVGAMGAYIYLLLSEDMADPTGLHDGINIAVGEDEYLTISIVLSPDSNRMFLVDLTGITVESGDDVTISLPGNTFESVEGVYLPLYTSHSVVNNV